MKRTLVASIIVLLFTAVFASADTFGTGANQFAIDFVTISGDSGDLGSWSAGSGYTFSGVNHGDYRMGTYEITNDQWNKFKADYGTVTGSPSTAYDRNSYWTGTNVPTNSTSWYEAAQFVNWLNTSTGHQEAYKFTGTIHTADYTFTVWDVTDAGYNASNRYRNSNAFYFLPTEDEWVKAAYWNGTNLQTWSSVGDITPTQSDWNFYDKRYPTNPYAPWNIGSGAEELNGTYDMMGNVWEWMESPDATQNLPDSYRVKRGGSYYGQGLIWIDINELSSFVRTKNFPRDQREYLGFRVASVPEPGTMVLLAFGGVMLRKREK